MVDIFFGLLVSFILLPLMIIVAIIIKLDSHGPVFFISERIGLNNKKFKMFNSDNVYKHRIIETSKIKNPNSKIMKLEKFLENIALMKYLNS